MTRIAAGCLAMLVALVFCVVQLQAQPYRNPYLPS